MNIDELKNEAKLIIEGIKNYGNYPSENNRIDYKKQLNRTPDPEEPLSIFMQNFAKDIIAFSNAEGGFIFIGIDDEKPVKEKDIGVTDEDLQLLNKIDLAKISDKFKSFTNASIILDLESTRWAGREFFIIYIGKQNQTIIPKDDKYKLKRGDVIYRNSAKNEMANESTTSFNQFLQIKSIEQNKEFMTIWSKLLPQMFDINPRDVLILNPKNNVVYGYNAKDKILSKSDVEIDQSQDGPFNIILNAIAAGEIGKISETDGKPIYKIVGEVIKSGTKEHIFMNIITKELKDNPSCQYKITELQIRKLVYHLAWTTKDNFLIDKPKEEDLNSKFVEFIWIEKINGKGKIVFSPNCTSLLIKEINQQEQHTKIFGKTLTKK
jgi:hypothetical protein